MTTRADGVSESVSVPSVGVICTVSTPNASPSARPTGAEIGLASSRAMPSRSSASSDCCAAFERSARSSASSRSTFWPKSSEMMSTSGSGGSELSAS